MSIPNPGFTPEHIKDVRMQLGLTQTEFGDRLGITQKAVSSWETHGLPRTFAVFVNLLELERRAAKKTTRRKSNP